ncbi:MAG: hypothetical protein A3E88_07155 [Legionellales bacterium RIFCSPHIGHO2_12_FULL_35_11]|nr:MAG: hypothetical protein A3E88_07155 [Legionellales bacterium RIFCSPHIGHO2_12_FULL_35_11]
MKSSSGFGLVLALLLLGVLSGFIFLQIDVILLYRKITNQFLIRQQIHAGLENLSTRLIYHDSASILHNCIIKSTHDPNSAVVSLRACIKPNCYINYRKLRYYFVFEDLETLDSSYDTKTAQQRRLTIGSIHNYFHGDSFLQIRFMLSQGSHSSPAIMSWRLFFA